MGPQFFETRMGRTFFEGTLPRIATALERIAASLERQDLDEEIDDAIAVMEDMIDGQDPEEDSMAGLVAPVRDLLIKLKGASR